MCFEGKGYLLTDAHTYRGISGAFVVIPAPTHREKRGDIPWVLLDINSVRLDVGNRELD
jgi:hypothetical protein